MPVRTFWGAVCTALHAIITSTCWQSAKSDTMVRERLKCVRSPPRKNCSSWISGSGLAWKAIANDQFPQSGPLEDETGMSRQTWPAATDLVVASVTHAAGAHDPYDVGRMSVVVELDRNPRLGLNGPPLAVRGDTLARHDPGGSGRRACSAGVSGRARPVISLHLGEAREFHGGMPATMAGRPGHGRVVRRTQSEYTGRHAALRVGSDCRNAWWWGHRIRRTDSRAARRGSDQRGSDPDRRGCRHGQRGCPRGPVTTWPELPAGRGSGDHFRGVLGGDHTSSSDRRRRSSVGARGHRSDFQPSRSRVDHLRCAASSRPKLLTSRSAGPAGPRGG